MVINFPAPAVNCEQILRIGGRAWFSDMKATNRFIPFVEEMKSGVHRRMRRRCTLDIWFEVERIDRNELVWERMRAAR
jgi:hypothetical protein